MALRGKTAYLAVVILLFAFVQAGCGPKRTSDVDLTPPGEGEAARETESYQIPENPFDKPPVQIYEEIPEYPEDARKNGVEGWVIIQAFVDKDGKVEKALVAKCSLTGYGFEDEAVKAAYLCRYQPAQTKLKNVGCWISYKVDFILDDPSEMEVLSDVDKPPVIIFREIAKYPREAYRNRVEAYVLVKAYVDEYGEVREAEAVRCSKIGFGFEEAAVKAAYQYRYRPARKGLNKVGTWITYKVDFSISD